MVRYIQIGFERGDFGFYYLTYDSFPTLGFTFGSMAKRLKSHPKFSDSIQF